MMRRLSNSCINQIKLAIDVSNKKSHEIRATVHKSKKNVQLQVSKKALAAQFNRKYSFNSFCFRLVVVINSKSQVQIIHNFLFIYFGMILILKQDHEITQTSLTSFSSMAHNMHTAHYTDNQQIDVNRIIIEYSILYTWLCACACIRYHVVCYLI